MSKTMKEVTNANTMQPEYADLLARLEAAERDAKRYQALKLREMNKMVKQQGPSLPTFDAVILCTQFCADYDDSADAVIKGEAND